MGLKRKHSNFDSSPSSVSSSSTYTCRDSLSPSPSQHAFSFDYQPAWQQCPRPQFSWAVNERDGGNSSGRTRKRYRDNRPDEQAVYANTFQKLFDAQKSQSQHQAQAPPNTLFDAMDAGDAPEQSVQLQPKSQSSLHKFFNISRDPTSNAMPVKAHIFEDPSARCQDCEATLGACEDSMMLDDSVGASDSVWACRRCRRSVCDLCAVVDGCAGRECLMCLTRAAQ